MRAVIIAMSLVLVAGCIETESSKDAMCSDIAQVYGDWDVALLFDSNQEPSTTTMNLEGDGNGVQDGSFYGSNFEASEMSYLPGYFVFSAQTSDGTGLYIHMARYDCSRDRMDGQTWSQGRDFLMTWTAERSNG